MHKFIIIINCLLFATSLLGQTTNSGVLYVSPNTQFSTVETLKNVNSGEIYNDGETFIYEGYDNEGIVGFHETGGITKFVGDTLQLISGDAEMFMYHILFDNNFSDAPFQLSGKISTVGTVDFERGIIDNDNFGGSFTFINSANHINTSNVSHVDGPVQKFGDTAFTYPIGDKGYYRFAGIAGQGFSSANFEGHYFLDNPGLLYDLNLTSSIIEVIDNQEYWTIFPMDSAGSSVITLSWDEITTPLEITEPPLENSIHIVRWDSITNMWVDEGGVVNVLNNSVTTAVEKYGVFTLAKVKSEDLLPCQIVVYNAVSPNGDGINDYFLIDNQGECAQQLKVKVFNRWGVKVFETDDYGLGGDVFDGYSSGRITLNDNKQLPTGTYFYILEYDYEDNSEIKTYNKAGYLYLNGN